MRVGGAWWEVYGGRCVVGGVWWEVYSGRCMDKVQGR